VIGTFGPSTIQPVVAASCLPDQLKTAVRDVLGARRARGGQVRAGAGLHRGLRRPARLMYAGWDRRSAVRRKLPSQLVI
jgi:hypothetical protein